ncbi:hypothetical protein MBM_07945 [Drepanopeziza brunnea f. sp. 'multigermtubi' MB_m1]|uniref:Sodium/calcium exchanger membrane region domain-containing protein n=2 Tax=Drepanopeziza brunnea f. sp. 'multigermtubi' TaxID=698441 RepID=K1XMQ6_MARBU|nr:uncharacterized protein MBM_07945 [Drepanopeziza brunnea f. sp. 'multigermtubi' MB_m1]EKD13744.1 hypothetical protein MBM_07945 [Drepanopeziza brunnea f. sp. 'multigermtubi' MB_m1]
MIISDNVVFNIAAFIGGLFVLEFGADRFIDHTAKLASRTGIPPTLVALLTAGAEWEELVVVVAAISQKQSPLALGNILGSSISNILGAFSLGLIFSKSNVTFDRSSKIYSGVLLGLTSSFAIFILFFESLGRIGGGLLMVAFVLYIVSIAWAIYKGIVSPPVDSDSDSDSDSAGPDSDSDLEKDSVPLREVPPVPNSESSSTITLRDLESGQHAKQEGYCSDGGLHEDMFDNVTLHPLREIKQAGHSTLYHLTHLTLGFLALSLSGYILSHSVTTLSTEFSLSSTVLGITLLSFATTLPEKLISIMSAKRGESGIVVANTAGSNIFLVTLCAGVVYLTGDVASLRGSVTPFEVGCMWASSVVLSGIVMLGGRRWMGWVLFAAYIVFIVCEFTIRRDTDV